MPAANTYAWWTEDRGLIALGRTQPALRTSHAEEQIRVAIDRGLARRGVERTDRTRADVLVAFTVDTVTRYRLEGGTGGGSFDVPSPSPKRTRWTLHLHVLDNQQRTRVWHGWTSAWLGEPGLSWPTIEQSVESVLDGYRHATRSRATAARTWRDRDRAGQS